MGVQSDHTKEMVRDAADIVEVISGYVHLSQRGGVFRGLCPFHAEKTPSFTVNPERRIFHCFGCGVGGDVFRFLMLHKGITFPEALADLAERYGIDLPRGGGGYNPRRKEEKSALYQAMLLARQYYEDELAAASGRQAGDYLNQRGLPPEIVREFHLGWAPEGWDNLKLFLDSKRIPPNLMERAGLIRPRSGGGRGHYDTFRARIITPVSDVDGKPIAFGGRLLWEDERQPKYINSPETPIYQKGRVLYGLDRHRDRLRDAKTALIVEGYFDLLSLAAHGVRNVVATMGTALTGNHLRHLKGAVHQVILVFDADEAGRSAAARSLPLFVSADLDARVLLLPDGHDPDTFVREHGPGALNELAGQATGLLDFYVEQTLTRYPETMAGRNRAVQEIMGVMGRVDGQARVEMLRRSLAEKLGLSENALQLSERRMEQGAEKQTKGPKGVQEQVLPDFEVGVLRLAVLHPEIAPDLFTAGIETELNNTVCRRLFHQLAEQLNRFGQMDIDRLMTDLESSDADFLTGLAMSDDGLRDEDVHQAVDDYIRYFSLRNQRNKSVELSRLIKEAQERGDSQHLKTLLQEKQRLLKERIL